VFPAIKKIPMKKRPVVFQPAFLFLAENPVVIHYAKLARTRKLLRPFSKNMDFKSIALVSNSGSRFHGKAITMTSTNKKPAPHTQRGDPPIQQRFCCPQLVRKHVITQRVH
jgi:hypothetical protein